MSDDFQVGDVVVRIAGDNWPMPIGAMDRVVGVEPYAVNVENEAETWVGLDLANYHPGFDNSGNEMCWCGHNFRKLPRADEAFTAQMRACKPHRVPA